MVFGGILGSFTFLNLLRLGFFILEIRPEIFMQFDDGSLIHATFPKRQLSGRSCA
jgi:hypothetical protein